MNNNNENRTTISHVNVVSLKISHHAALTLPGDDVR